MNRYFVISPKEGTSAVTAEAVIYLICVLYLTFISLLLNKVKTLSDKKFVFNKR